MRISWKRAVLAVAAFGTVSGMVWTAPSAQAAPGAILGVAGSDTTEEVMASVALSANGDYNIPAAPPAPFSVPGDAACAARTYDDAPLDAGETLAPNGSSNGIAALFSDPGCIDIARSSRSRAASDNANARFFSFAKDYQWWATPSPNAPATLSHQELAGIFRDCTITDWSQVGGRAAPIWPVAPNPGSGSFAFFRDKVIRGNYGACVFQATAPAIIQENSCDSPAMRNDARFINAIVPYSGGQWALQEIRRANGPALDFRNGCRIGGGEVTDPDDAGPLGPICGQAVGSTFFPLNYSAGTQNFSINATFASNANADANNPSGNGTGCGARNLFNVTAQGSPQQAAAEGLVGQGSPLCTSQRVSQIVAAGFLPRATTGVSCDGPL